MIRRPLLLALLGLVVLFGTLTGTSRMAQAAPYAAMVMDARTGEVLHSRNADTRLHPASLTKMMTLYIAFEAVRLGEITMDTRVTISRRAANTPYAIGFRSGSQVRLRYLVRAAAVRSSNDAAAAIAEAIEGSEAAFARRMNRTAVALGMSRTTFRNPHGLTEEGHLSTARDMTTMGRRLFYDYPQYYNIFARRTADVGIATVRNTNRRVLEAYRGADGIKTGYTRAAGYNLVSSAVRGNVRILATVFGGRSSTSRNERIMELLDMGFARAPANAPTRRPDLPIYGTPGGVGRSTRTTGQVTSSLIPLLRPVDPLPEPSPALLAAVEEAVEDAIADSVATDIATAEIADEVLQDVSESVTMAEAADPAPNIQPELRPQPGPDATELANLPVDPPRDPAETEVETAEIDTDVAEIVELADAALEALHEAEAEALVADTLSPDGDVSEGREVALAVPEEVIETPAATHELAAAEVPLIHPELRPVVEVVDSMEMELAVIDPEPDLPAQEIVTRASSTGSRLYGVSLGRFPSQFHAEQELIRTVLAELGTFDTALRNVVNRTGGWEAQFAGMSESDAERACARLMSRNVTCTTYGP